MKVLHEARDLGFHELGLDAGDMGVFFGVAELQGRVDLAEVTGLLVAKGGGGGVST